MGWGELFFKVVNKVALGRGLACHCNFSKACSGLVGTGHQTQRLDLGGMPGPGAGTAPTRLTAGGTGRKPSLIPAACSGLWPWPTPAPHLCL